MILSPVYKKYTPAGNELRVCLQNDHEASHVVINRIWRIQPDKGAAGSVLTGQDCRRSGCLRPGGKEAI